MLANYQQTKISAPPNLNEPIGFDQLPDGRIIQTARLGQVRLHDPSDQSTKLIANVPVYTHSEDGLYGPAVDRNFEQNHWVYLYYSPVSMEGNDPSGKPYPATTPSGAAPTTPQASRERGTRGAATSSSRASSSSTVRTRRSTWRRSRRS